MKLEIVQLGVDDKNINIDLNEKTESINLLVIINDDEENEDNMLFSFEEIDDKLICYDTDGDIVSNEKPQKLSLEKMIEFFNNSSYFGDDVIVNKDKIIVNRLSTWMDNLIMKIIAIGCEGRDYEIIINDGTFTLEIKIN